jgi:NADPH:quinone reductase-like Zn-dependent oxidoreductase
MKAVFLEKHSGPEAYVLGQNFSGVVGALGGGVADLEVADAVSGCATSVRRQIAVRAPEITAYPLTEACAARRVSQQFRGKLVLTT